jgi:hypothetical protein
MAILGDLNWHAGIGDPTLLGWTTFLAYFFSALVSLKVCFSARQLFSAELVLKQQCFWLVFALILLMLGINKQLDLQSLLTAIGRYYAQRDGWYEHRRAFQVYALSGGLVFIISISLLFMYKMADIIKTNRLAILGLSLIGIYIVIRASSFHHVDLFEINIFGVNLNWVLELSGIVAIGVSAISLHRE